MRTDKKLLSFENVRQIDLVDYLSSLGHHPVKIRNADHWYLSPLRTERTASFKVNRKLNQWYDHGLGEGGGLLHFGALFYHCSRKEFLQTLNSYPGVHLLQPCPAFKERKPREPQIKIIREEKLSSFSLLHYISDRRIPEEIAQRYCKQVTFEMRRKRYCAIGFCNNLGGFELRNRWFKGSSAPKTITSFHYRSARISVFEGFFDFLTYQTISQDQEFEPTDFLILNSIAFFEKSRPLMERYPRVDLFLDRDKSGKALTQKAAGLSDRYRDQSTLYKGYNDLNEWVREIGKCQKRGIWYEFK
ncbi:MAG: toprim domain-containing protein [Bacteroidota bacterium]|nr:toprim domain-containing protein [Bacteroidota bacterium]